MTDEEARAKQELARGREKEKQRVVVTTQQLPVYRAAANMLYVVVDELAKAPRKLTRYSDKIVCDCSEVLKEISLANESRGEERRRHISAALATVNPIRTQMKVLALRGLMSKDADKRFVGMTRNICSQLARWRETTNREGHGELIVNS